MNSKLFFLIGLITVSVVYSADSDYNFKNDVERCVDTSDALLDGASENAGNCELYQGLVNISTKVSVNLTVTQKTTFTTFIEKCKTEIFGVSTLTNEEKFIEFSSYLEEFSLANQDIYGIIVYQNISKWSSIHTVEKVTIIKQQKLIQKSVTWESSTNSCPICDALKEAASETGDASCVTDVQTMIDTKIKVIMEDSSISFEEKTIKIQTEIQKIYVSHSSFESKLKFKKIKGFGRFNQFFKCIKTYEQVQEAPTLCTGTFPNIPIITYLQTQLNIYKKTDIKVALQFNQFIQRVNQSFQEITSVEERHLWFANYVQQWTVLNYNFCMKFIMTIEFGEFGSCYDFCFCEGFEGPVIVIPPTEIPEVPITSSSIMPSTDMDEEETDFTDEFSSSTSFFTVLPSSSSSCGCVCE